MRKSNYKGKCQKRKLEKCIGVCKTYDALMYAYADELVRNENVSEIRCNIVLDNESYMSDFVCVKTDGELMVRECVYKKHLGKPMTLNLLDMSRKHWNSRGVNDWGIVIDE